MSEERYMTVRLIHKPDEKELLWFKKCVLGTMGKDTETPPTQEFIHKILRARHSPAKELLFKFELIDVPYWVSVHLVRHNIGVNWYVQSQRNDRQDKYDRNSARQDEPITMRCTINAMELMHIANMRLCSKASKETHDLVQTMCRLVEENFPAIKGLLVPMCEYQGGRCDEIHPCGRYKQ